MDCKHDLAFLMGTADGIVCRCCGRVFKNFAEIQGEAAPVADKPAEKAEKAATKKARAKK